MAISESDNTSPSSPERERAQDTPMSTERIEELIVFASEQFDNATTIADEKYGEDRAGWLADASLHRDKVQALRELLTVRRERDELQARCGKLLRMLTQDQRMELASTSRRSAKADDLTEVCGHHKSENCECDGEPLGECGVPAVQRQGRNR